MALRHFFYGGAPGVAEELARRLSDRFPGMILAGTDSPPFGPLPPEEPAESLRKIRDARPDVLWVGLGTPKQERWMSARRAALRVPLLVGVGAAFDIHAGRLAQAPAWMREHGMEWFHRLLAEPRRLWKRYLLEGGEFGLRMLFTLFTGGLRSV
jgi:N-acetylglucosaminyldiphosphoundecaprenol N-acetyl-beta-D-mannosaminyltransferase